MTTIGNQLTPFPVDINERALRAEVDTLSMTIYTALKLRYPIHCRECGDDMLARPRDGVTEVRRVSDAVFACPSCHPWSARHATPEPER